MNNGTALTRKIMKRSGTQAPESLVKRMIRAELLGLGIGALGLLFSLAPFVLDLEEDAGLDWLFSLRGPLTPPSDVAVISIAGDSAEALALPNQPDRWPRFLHADLVDQLRTAGAAVIVFDIIFDRPREPDYDQRFANAIREAGNVILLERLRTQTIPVTGAGAAAVADTWLLPIPVLKQAALASAPFPLPVVPVKVGQFWAFGRSASDRPTLPVLALQAYGLEAYPDFIALLGIVRPGLTEGLPKTKEDLLRQGSIERVVIDIRSLFRSDPLIMEEMLAALDHGRFDPGEEQSNSLLRELVSMYGGDETRYLNYYGPQRTILPTPYINALRLSPDDAVARSLKGKVVFVGFSEQHQPEQQDAFYSVFSQRTGLNLSGVEIAATAFANLLEGSSVRPLPMPWHLALVFAWGLLITIAVVLPGTMLGIGAAVVMGSLYVALANFEFRSNGIWMPMMVPLFLQIPAALFGAVVWEFAGAKIQSRRIQKTLGYYLPRSLIDQLADDPVEILSSTQSLHGTCLVTDAEQYTALAEKLQPVELRNLMNDYYQELFQVVEKHGGLISVIVGDSMVAIWTAPESVSVISTDACRASLELLSGIERFNRSNPDRTLPTRIGLHTGQLLIGTVGAESHFEYRAVGDIVTTASRLQGLNKQLGTRLLVSDTTVRCSAGFITRELGQFLLVGKKIPLSVHELMGVGGKVDSVELALREAFAEAFTQFQAQHWTEAAQKFRRLLEHFEGDGPAQFYLRLCEEFMRQAPGPSWQGAISITEK